MYMKNKSVCIYKDQFMAEVSEPLNKVFKISLFHVCSHSLMFWNNFPTEILKKINDILAKNLTVHLERKINENVLLL